MALLQVRARCQPAEGALCELIYALARHPRM